jgi:uncharacterized protein YhbP (UPF0306 family)
MKKYFNAVRPYLDHLELMVIASSYKDQPWCATVYFAFDESLIFYFLSRANRRHSEEISIPLCRRWRRSPTASKINVV